MCLIRGIFEYSKRKRMYRAKYAVENCSNSFPPLVLVPAYSGSNELTEVAQRTSHTARFNEEILTSFGGSDLQSKSEENNGLSVADWSQGGSLGHHDFFCQHSVTAPSPCFLVLKIQRWTSTFSFCQGVLGRPFQVPQRGSLTQLRELKSTFFFFIFNSHSDRYLT